MVLLVGERQGDPLSSLLFVLVMEVLNALLLLADDRGIFQTLQSKIRERSFMYADDVVIFVSPKQQDLIITRGILEIFCWGIWAQNKY